MKKINILHMYPDLLNLYGDKGNILSLLNRLKWRGIDAEVITTSAGEAVSLDDIDIVFIGGGSDREEEIVREELLKIKDKLSEYVENGGVLLAACGGFQVLGKYIETKGQKAECLGILDIYTEIREERVISNVVLESELFKQKLVGFENHSGRVNIGSHTPLGKVLYGGGNMGDGEHEGVIYKNVFGTYLHGPVLPKNPMFCDYILSKALEKKYSDFEGLEPLNDELENLANEYIVSNYSKK